MKIWSVYDGEETHIVVAETAVDVLVVLSEVWGHDTMAEYLEAPGCEVTKVTEERAQQMSYTHEDDQEGDPCTIWEEWMNDKSRRLVGSSG